MCEDQFGCREIGGKDSTYNTYERKFITCKRNWNTELTKGRGYFIKVAEEIWIQVMLILKNETNEIRIR